jgi:hypothetical protein
MKTKYLISFILLLLISCSENNISKINSKKISLKDNSIESIKQSVPTKDNNDSIVIDEYDGGTSNIFKQTPLFVDTSVIDIFLSNPKQSEKILGNKISLIIYDGSSDNDFLPHVNYYNKSKKEILTLVSFPGGIKNSFQEIYIRYAKNSEKEFVNHLNNIPFFITGKGIKLGISKKSLISLLGDNYKIGSDNNIEILSYTFEEGNYHSFLDEYGLPLYYGMYTFKNDKLINFSFGFEYP